MESILSQIDLKILKLLFVLVISILFAFIIAQVKLDMDVLFNLSFRWIEAFLSDGDVRGLLLILLSYSLTLSRETLLLLYSRSLSHRLGCLRFHIAIFLSDITVVFVCLH
jgi:hypothetical protein